MNNPVDCKYAIGMKVWLGRALMDGEENYPCPDCKGQKVWTWKSPAGDEGTTECPRCHGRGTLGQHNFSPDVRQLTVGSIRTDSAIQGERRIEYMCVETGIGSGSVYWENDLYASEETARTCASLDVLAQNKKLDKMYPDRAIQVSLYRHNIKDAMVEEAERVRRAAESRVNRLLERICELDEFPVAGNRYSDNPSCNLTDAQIRAVQESLVWLNDDDSNFLDEWREAGECEC